MSQELADKLIEIATDIVKKLDEQNPAYTREQIKELPFDMLSMDPAALQFVVRGAQYLAAFTEEIGKKKDSLQPWVTVYGAGLGMQAVFNRILWIWSRTDKPQGTEPVPPDVVTKAIKEDIERYVKVIAG